MKRQIPGDNAESPFALKWLACGQAVYGAVDCRWIAVVNPVRRSGRPELPTAPGELYSGC